ncbi:MAG: hypothetical protein JWP25_4741 [Bradyrhizobium sp.]|jgi:hypothetical protein|nr:hypothetical protein [Bradyrhizobium sp.]
MTSKLAISLVSLGTIIASVTAVVMPGPASASPLSSTVEQPRAVCGPQGCLPPNYFAGRPSGSTLPHYFGGYTRPHYFGGYAYARSRPHQFGYTTPHYFGEDTDGYPLGLWDRLKSRR